MPYMANSLTKPVEIRRVPKMNRFTQHHMLTTPALDASPGGLHIPHSPPRTFIPPSEGERIVFNNITYFIGRQLGVGAFATVYECHDEWGNELAAKVIGPQSGTYEQVRAVWHDELTKLVHLRHPNITYLHAAFEYRDTFYIVMERCAMTLSDILRTQGLNGELWIPHVARNVLHALHFIHGSRYVHKDLHAGNILVSHQRDTMATWKEPIWQFKVADLGISNLEGNIRQPGTMLAEWILPPECIDSNEFGAIGRGVDIYHAGLLLLQLLYNQPLHFSKEEILNGNPRRMAEAHSSPYGAVIALALRRHVQHRTSTAIDFWRAISGVASTCSRQVV